jgi:multidrug efflux pump subunit AcrB
MQLPKLAIKNAQFTLTIVVLLVLVGIVSYFQMPRSEDPQFDMPITLIEVIYPGASPTDIESLVVNPLEAVFKRLNLKSKMVVPVLKLLFCMVPIQKLLTTK